MFFGDSPTSLCVSMQMPSWWQPLEKPKTSAHATHTQKLGMKLVGEYVYHRAHRNKARGPQFQVETGKMRKVHRFVALSSFSITILHFERFFFFPKRVITFNTI